MIRAQSGLKSMTREPEQVSDFCILSNGVSHLLATVTGQAHSVRSANSILNVF